jgi:hypothetical protein
MAVQVTPLLADCSHRYETVPLPVPAVPEVMVVVAAPTQVVWSPTIVPAVVGAATTTFVGWLYVEPQEI